MGCFSFGDYPTTSPGSYSPGVIVGCAGLVDAVPQRIAGIGLCPSAVSDWQRCLSILAAWLLPGRVSRMASVSLLMVTNTLGIDNSLSI